MVVAQPVQMRAGLPAQVEQMLEAGSRHERGARALALEQRIRRDGRPVREALDRPGSDSPRGREHGLLLARGRRHLGGRHASVLDEDCVRERSADVDAQNAHAANVRGRPCVEGRDGGTNDGDQAPGAGGEPVDFRRTIASHGVADLPPNRIDEQAWTLELTLAPGGSPATTVLVSEGRKGHAKVKVLAGRAKMADLRPAVAHVLRLDEDLRPFYEAAASDPDLSGRHRAPAG